MKRFLAIALASSLLMFAGNALAVDFTHSDTYTAGDVAGGIVQSRHNLGALSEHVATRSGGSIHGPNTGTTQICIFCHTPHHTNTNARPLWNRVMPNSGSYSSYGVTIAGTTVGQGVDASLRAGSVSLACLSCHDGVTAFDNLVNGPGKDKRSGSQGWKFYDGGSFVTNPSIGGIDGGVNPFNFTKDLTDDHPINVTYRAGKAASLRATSTTISNINLSAGLTPTTESDVTANLWAVAGFVSSTATIADLLRADNGTSGNVECSSCHDPHFNNKSWTEIDPTYCGNGVTNCVDTGGMFLRRIGGNAGSGVCRTCHEK